MINILLDIDVILDILAPRPAFFNDSFAVLNLCALKKVNGWLTADSFGTLHYLLHKNTSEAVARQKILTCLESLSVIPVRRGTIESALHSALPDFEDNIKVAAAERFHIERIVTRNIKDYRESSVTACTPETFIDYYKSASPSKDRGPVPFLDLKAQHHQVYNEIDDRFTDIVANTAFILGKQVEDFEERFAAAHGAAHCLGVSSGTDALHLALMAIGIGPGDTAVVPANTFFATAEAVSLCGATPVFVDCDAYFNLDAQKLEQTLAQLDREGRPVPKVLIPVHLYGQPADMAAIGAVAAARRITLVEDCAQAHLARDKGRPVGTAGAFGCFSFYPGKNLGAWGEAGAVVCNDAELYRKARMIRQHGEIERYHHEIVGHNYRMEAFQGAVLGNKLKFLEGWTAGRRRNAALYTELLAEVEEVETPKIRPGAEAVFHLYVIQAERRDELQKFLSEKGIATGLHYPVPLHLQPAYRHLGYKAGDFPMAERAAKRILSLPMYPELEEEQVRYVVEMIKDFWSAKK